MEMVIEMNMVAICSRKKIKTADNFHRYVFIYLFVFIR